MRLSELILGVDGQLYNMKDVEIRSLEFDSRKINRDALYIAVQGARYDGHNFIREVESKGAVAVVTQKKVDTTLPQIVVSDTRDVLRKLAKRFYGNFDKLIKIGVTGTNGKTTTAFLIHSILTQARRNPGLIGTVYYLSKTTYKATRTTPEALDILKLYNEFEMQGLDSVVMEVSSHALKLKRVEDIDFDVAVFTNLSQDHLDFHDTMDDYRASKLHIFSLLKQNGHAVYNNDDEIGAFIKALPLVNKISFGTKTGSDIQARIVEQTLDGLRLMVRLDGNEHEVRSALIGEFNLYNILAAFAAGIALDIDTKNIVGGIEKLKTVRGRMERVVSNIFVDFAHTPAAIENVLRSLRKYAVGRLIIVFGCGGDRDKDKRPKMGAIASKLADMVVITSDNPRTEVPTQIIDDIKRGIIGNNYKIVEDRVDAIRYAISSRDDSDIVVIAGKGHEEYQIVGDREIEFDDAEVVRKCSENSC
ncbi:hypothetical protein AMJ83_05450 [candidate division WOR_3 bacterium SM23_42]|uniref:UDP-N-acetylmuramoyl-L-alanyl-D-glutamate--2,6-diaminopimelate ligase n=1 Tax=candidate division WOR_3 bacterium SM23_42 TaxID=1703779 RepID=A0A0S8FT39_UNCW3|nr:MAG: hypothetical protein AMJ83_05450 [candidate division WOR_3 bacterium SM23_42]